MRLSSPSAAILSIVAASGGHAFAPPRSYCSSVSTRLHARNELLSGMLSEYSGRPPPPSEVAESGMDSLTKAASVAQDAADQAASAAAAVAAKATSDGGQYEPGSLIFQKEGFQLPDFAYSPPDRSKLPSFTPPFSSNTNDANVARMKENYEIFKANWNEMIGATGSVGETAASSSNNAIADFIASLHLGEYGGWYAAALVALIATWQRSAGKEAAKAQFESELTKAREKANEASSAANLAAEGAKTARDLAMKMEKDLQKGGGEALLESSRSKMVEMEKVSIISLLQKYQVMIICTL